MILQAITLAILLSCASASPIKQDKSLIWPPTGTLPWLGWDWDLIMQQILNGIDSGEVDAAFGGVGKRDLTEEELKGLWSSITNIVKPILTSVVTEIAIDAAIGLVGKRDTSKIVQLPSSILPLGDLTYPILTTGGLNFPILIASKRDLTEEEIKGISWSSIGNSLTSIISNPIVIGVATNLITTAVGKRDLTEEEIKGISWSSIGNTLTSIASNPIVIGVATNLITTAVGKRDLTEEEIKGISWSSIGNTLTSIASNPIVIGVATNLITTAVGKRDTEELRNFWTHFVQPALQAHVTGLLAPILGK